MGRQTNYYELLELTTTQEGQPLSQEHVKAAYKRALLRYHPDKRPQDSNAGSSNSKSSATVDDIALAYKTLSEPALKAEYDRWLRTSAQGTVNGLLDRPLHTGLETVDLDDLSFDSKTGLWSRSCRCGDTVGFTVSERELERHSEDGEIIVGCKGCSLWLRVLFGVED